MEIFILLFSLFILIIGMPIGYLLGVVCIGGLFDMGGWPFLRIIASRFFSGTENFILITVPFFILAAEFMNRSGMTERIINFVRALIGHYRGGLSHVNIGASILFAGMSGAAVTDTIAIGNIIIPAMKKDGYSPEYSAAVTAASAIVGPIIPPSVTMIVYGYITHMSVAALFSAGIIPGLVMGALLLVVSGIMAVRHNHPRQEKRASLKEMIMAWWHALLALIVPIIILGSILAGIATVTESSAVAVGYAFFIGMFIFRTLKLKDLVPACIYTAKLTGIIFLILATAHTFGWYITRLGIPAAVAELIFNITDNPILVLLMINIFLIIIGMFMDILPAVLILTPVLAPAAKLIGVDPLHFALIMLVNLNIGMITPPFGMTLITSAKIANTSYDSVIIAVWPFLLAEMVTLGLITYIPWLVLSVPKLLGFA
jgi:TRAP-type transport system large permease protein